MFHIANVSLSRMPTFAVGLAIDGFVPLFVIRDAKIGLECKASLGGRISA